MKENSFAEGKVQRSAQDPRTHLGRTEPGRYSMPGPMDKMKGPSAKEKSSPESNWPFLA